MLSGRVGWMCIVSASPLYWAFIDPASPLGALFFAAAVILLVWSAKRFADQLADTDACSVQPTHGGE